MGSSLTGVTERWSEPRQPQVMDSAPKFAVYFFFYLRPLVLKQTKKKFQTWARWCWKCPPRNSGKDLVEVDLDLTWLAVLPPLEIDLLMRCSGDWTRTVSVALPNSLALRHLTLLHYPPESTDKSFAFLTFRLIACLYLTNHSVAYELCN